MSAWGGVLAAARAAATASAAVARMASLRRAESERGRGRGSVQRSRGPCKLGAEDCLGTKCVATPCFAPSEGIGVARRFALAGCVISGCLSERDSTVSLMLFLSAFTVALILTAFATAAATRQLQSSACSLVMNQFPTAWTQ